MMSPLALAAAMVVELNVFKLDDYRQCAAIGALIGGCLSVV